MRTQQTLSIAAAMLITGTILGGSAERFVGAAVVDSTELLAFVPIEPCRLADTRPGSGNVGPRNGKLGTGQTQVFDAFDPSTTCTGEIPSDATSISTNITALGATAQSFLTVWADGPRPNASSLNPAPGEPPTPNAVTTELSSSGTFRIYNEAGETHVLTDVIGYYVNHDERVSNEIFVGAGSFGFVTEPSGYPYYESIPSSGGYPGLYLGGTDPSTFITQWTVGSSYSLTDQLEIEIGYVAHDDNLIANPDGCSFALYTSGATVFERGRAPMWVDATFVDSQDSTPNEFAVEWEPDNDGHAPTNYVSAEMSGFVASADAQVALSVSRIPNHSDDTCTDDMTTFSARITRSL